MIEKIKKVSFRTKLIVLVESILVTTTVICGLLVYNNIQFLTSESLKNKLIAIASSTSSILDAETLKSFDDPSVTSTEEYANLIETLTKITENNENVDDVYVMKKSEQENIWHFIASTFMEDEDLNGNGIIEENEKGAYFGKDFDVSPFPEMQQAFEKKIADKEIYCDSWGCWLSGYAPIFDKNGEAIAIVGVDISAQDALSYENKIKLSLLTILAIISFSSPLFLFFHLKTITKPFVTITDSINKFSEDLSTRIDIQTGDEFEIIANSFNKMASSLSHIIGNFESEVNARTKEISEEKNKTESILKSIGDGVFVVDKNFKTIMFNRVAERITGFSAGEVIGNRIDKIIQILNIQTKEKDDACFIEEVIKTGKLKKSSAPTLLITKRNREVPIMKSASPLKNKEGETIGCLVVFRDLSHEYEVDKAKTEFVSLASHQLRTPLSSINWYTEMLLSKDVGEVNRKQKEYLNQIYEGNQRMINLVNSLLNVSRLEIGTFIVEPEKIDITKIADNVILELTPKMKERNIKILKKYQQDIPRIPLDPRLTRIIFQNILSNAIKYNKPKKNIELKIEKDNQNLNIEISDQGLGIPKKQQRHIFTKFFRADNVRQTETEGTGLGLYLVKTIIDKVGGKVSFKSIEGEGTTFYVSIPREGMKAKKGTREIINIKI